jgi:fluoride exporter
MVQILIIGLGGGIGSILRYLVSTGVQTGLKNTSFPYGTLLVNVLGCFIIGLLSYLSDTKGILDSETRAFLLIGCLGGFTTFSTFGNETVNLMRGGEYLPGLLNAGMHLLLGLGAVFLGRLAAQSIWR